MLAPCATKPFRGSTLNGLLADNANFVAFSQYFSLAAGEIFVFFVLAVAAAESVIGLAIVVLLFRQRGSIKVDDITALKG